jgi:hypothetical protein
MELPLCGDFDWPWDRRLELGYMGFWWSGHHNIAWSGHYNIQRKDLNWPWDCRFEMGYMGFWWSGDCNIAWSGHYNIQRKDFDWPSWDRRFEMGYMGFRWSLIEKAQMPLYWHAPTWNCSRGNSNRERDGTEVLGAGVTNRVK